MPDNNIIQLTHLLELAKLKKTSALTQMGFEVVSLDCGVYTLTRHLGPGQALNYLGFGLFYSEKPLSTAQEVVFVQTPDYRDVSESRFNAIRDNLTDTNLDIVLEDPAYDRAPMPFIPEIFGRVIVNQAELTRFTTPRKRPVGITETGDVICYR